MIYLIVGAIIAIVLFLCAYLGFKEGLRLGMNASKGISPTPLKNPIQIVEDSIELINVNKENTEYDKELAEMLMYTGDKPKG